MTARDLDGLVAANADFYAEFERLDLDGMAARWEQSDDVWCVHPGGELLRGWPAVRRGWAAIFANTPYPQFIVTDVAARLDGALGAVTCTENVISAAGGGEAALGGGRVLATNLLSWRGGAWRMVAHHASPVLRLAR